jgi:hypothetical protein
MIGRLPDITNVPRNIEAEETYTSSAAVSLHCTRSTRNLPQCVDQNYIIVT